MGLIRDSWQIRLFRSLANSCQSGLTVAQALEILDRAGPLGRVAEDVSGGISLSEAMRRHPGYFPAWQVEIVAVGEATGRLDKSLRVISNILEERREFWASLAPGLAYPVLLIHLAPLLLWANLLYAGQYRDFIKLALGFIGTFYLPIVAGYLAWILWLRQSPWRRRMPLAASFAKAQFCFYLSSMIRAGVSLPRALEMSASASGLQQPAGLSLMGSSTEVLRGLVETLQSTNVFSRDELGQLKVAELSGRIDEELEQIAKQSQQKWQLFLKSVVVILPPVVYLLVMIAVGVRVISFWWGYYSSLNALISR